MIQNRPKMTPFAQGDQFKTIQVEAESGMKMPTHHTTKEAVIMVRKGEAILRLPQEERHLRAGDSFILPAEMQHSLEVIQHFSAMVVMAIESEIKF